MIIKSLLYAALTAAMGAALVAPAQALNNWDDGGGKKFIRENCESAMKAGVMPMSVLPMPWCMDMKTGKMTPFFMMVRTGNAR